ncbi:hypothetical protein [Megalodesulfovibrio gigas]|uniref:Uncharacterized protein n=1 Tax=Megalodesulfovibrio gigas (strain ATCC 19364 / DSM 1382 / NCIMB 9332 / VKM B-1759) TaxID=1121448 RepID=T2GCC7_MEGG1|nr:hypothetical protein [Megalodesulfovibrio gigas]AGW13776.1 hypothetical protein DGI_2002 [Megalodesulfovibrio gigas DSM 1382 = ATCC 19364]
MSAATAAVRVAVLVSEVTEHNILARPVEAPADMPTVIDFEDIEAINPPLEVLQTLPPNSRALLTIPQDLAVFAGFTLGTDTPEPLLQETPDHALAASAEHHAPALEAPQDAPAPLAVAAVDAAAHVADPGLPALTEHALQLEAADVSLQAEALPPPVVHSLDGPAWEDTGNPAPAHDDARLQPATHLEGLFITTRDM